jgi:D-alanyl-D-alanine carboxypeptidase (penicillin-binding protein 5/6)
MTDTNYKNSSGWPADDHYSTCRDLAILSRRTIEDFPQYYPIYAEREFKYGGILQQNRNTLLSRSTGADGLKTGHTEAAGYGISVSVQRQGRRIVMVLNGMSSMRTRAVEAERIGDWAYREFENYTLVKAGEVIDKADVWLGVDQQVALTAASTLIVTLPRKFRKDMKVTLSYSGPLSAPIAKGAPVAKLLVSAPSVETIELPLVAGADVAQLSGFGRVREVAMIKIFGRR